MDLSRKNFEVELDEKTESDNTKFNLLGERILDKNFTVRLDNGNRQFAVKLNRLSESIAHQ